MTNPGLIDRNELLKLFPALRGRGKNPRYRVDWLVRQRAIPFIRIGKRSIFFDPEKIREWIKKHEIPVQNGEK